MEYPEDFEKVWAVMSQIHNKPSKRETFKKYEIRCKEYCSDHKKEATDFSAYLISQIKAETRYRKKKNAANEFIAEWSYWTTYLNQYRYENEFIDTPHHELQDKIDSESAPIKCFINDCPETETIYHSGKPFCKKHIDILAPNPYRDFLRDAWNKLCLNLERGKDDESWCDWYRRIYRPHLVKRGGALNKLPYNKEERINETELLSVQPLSDEAIERGVEYYEALKREQENSMGIPEA